MVEAKSSRRLLLVGGAGVVLGACATSSGARTQTSSPGAGGEEEVSPAEDLMREHGLLERILLVYEEAARRISGEVSQPVPGNALLRSAQIVRTFVEDYHERLEEKYVFPALEKAGREVDLVKTLRIQHDAGRHLTDLILAAIPNDVGQAGPPPGKRIMREGKTLPMLLTEFSRMYRPHAAREDTVLFPAFKAVIPRAEYEQLGDVFEDKEHELFGPEGFEKNVAEIAEIEKAFGIGDLSLFTPTAP